MYLVKDLNHDECLARRNSSLNTADYPTAVEGKIEGHVSNEIDDKPSLQSDEESSFVTMFGGFDIYESPSSGSEIEQQKIDRKLKRREKRMCRKKQKNHNALEAKGSSAKTGISFDSKIYISPYN